MICKRCRTGHHERCQGGTWCDCQHQPPGTGITDVVRARVPAGEAEAYRETFAGMAEDLLSDSRLAGLSGVPTDGEGGVA